MDYQKMWFELKEKMVQEAENNEKASWRSQAAQRHLNLMSKIEVESNKEEECSCCGCCDGEEPEPQKGERANRDLEEKLDGKKILKKIFGDDYAEDVETLEKKIYEKGTKVILLDNDLEIPEQLEKEAKERKIMIAKAEIGAIEVRKGMPFPFPFPLEFMK